MSLTYEDAVRKLERAKDKQRGRPIGYATRVCQRNGYIAVEHHYTAIIRLYPDGSKDICTDWSSKTTRDRLWKYGGIRVYTKKLPTYNGRLPETERAVFMSVNGQSCVFNGVNGYIRISAHGRIDTDTIKPLELTIIADAKRARQIQTKVRAICKQCLIRVRLLGRTLSETARPYFWDSVMDYVDKPLNEVNYNWLLDVHPSEEQLQCGIPQYRIAKKFGLTGQVPYTGLLA